MAKFTVDAKYLSYADIAEHEDTVLTIKSYEHEMMGQGKDAAEKWVLYFCEIKKGLGLNKTNGKMCCKLFQTDDMDAWIGQKVALYVKDDVEFQGEIVSAIRVRSKLPGTQAPALEDLSSLTFEETIYRLDHASSLKEIGALMTHGIELNCTPEQLTMLKDAKESRITALMQ
mgnify:CR=1 FL=1